LNLHFYKIFKSHCAILHNFWAFLSTKNLSGHSHIKIRKAKCIRSLSILKFLSHPSKSCNRKILLQLYKSLIHSRLDYGAPIYGLANKSVLSLLDTIQTSALRLAFGAFRTNLKLSLCAEASDPIFPSADWSGPLTSCHLSHKFSIFQSATLFSSLFPTTFPFPPMNKLKFSSSELATTR